MSLRVELDRSALLLMDFQHDVCAAGGRMAPRDGPSLERFAEAITEAERALLGARAAGLPVLHVRHAFEPGYPELAEATTGHALTGLQRYIRAQSLFIDGDPGTEFVAPLRPDAKEPVIRKTTISPFVNTELGPSLAAAGVDTVIIAGMVTHYVVLATCFDAGDRGLRVIVLRDACSSGDLGHHRSCLAIMQPVAELRTSAELCEALANAPR